MDINVELDRIIRTLKVDERTRKQITDAIKSDDVRALTKIEDDFRREYYNSSSTARSSRMDMIGARGPAYQLRGFTNYRNAQSTSFDMNVNYNLISRIIRIVNRGN